MRDDIIASVSFIGSITMLFGAVHFYGKGDYTYCAFAILQVIVFTVVCLAFIAKMLKNNKL